MFNPSVVQGENLFVLTSLMIVEIINEFIRVYLNNFAQNLYKPEYFLLQEVAMFSANPFY